MSLDSWLDANAAGWGWYVDATPGDDSEYLTPGDQGEQGHMDLLTAIAHEVGHLLGYEHSDDGTMHDTLATSERHTPTLIVGPVGDRPQRVGSVRDRPQRVGPVGDRPQGVEPAVFDLIFIEENDKKTTWSSDRLARDLFRDLDLAPVR